MSQIDRRIERLIIRRLDGELTDEERLELDPVLLASPEMRRLVEQYERIDAASAAALEAVVGDAADERVAFVPATGGRRYSRAWWALPAAAAAALALIAVLVPRPPGDSGTVITELGESPAEAPERAPEAVSDPGVYRAAYEPGQLDRAIDQDSLYLVGDDGRVYVIDRQRVRTARRPNRDSLTRRVFGDL
jgi:anti-sigma factor RsiW